MAQSIVNRSLSYLLKTPYSYYFRMKIPMDLQPQAGKKELRYLLRTGYLSEAKSKARLTGGQVQKLFRQMRSRGGYDMTKLDQTKINKIIRTVIKESLDEEASMRINRKLPLASS